MGLADIAISGLESDIVRNSIGNAGIRIFKGGFENPQRDNEGNIISWLWNQGKRLVGFLFEQAGRLISFSLTTLWGWFTSTLQYIWNFNWNITDKEIDQQIQQRWEALGGMLGGTLGNFVGYLGCGVVPGATIFSFNEPLGAYVLQNVGEELAEEFIGNVSNLVRYTFISGTQSLLMWSFKNARKFFKANASFFGQVFGQSAADAILAWGEPGSKPWSFAKAVEDKINSIPNTFVKNFVEEFLEESWEGCVEAGYVVANSVDSFIAAEKIKQQNIPSMGRERYVEIQPDRTIEKQKIVLAGPEEVLKAGIVNTLTNHQLMADKDIGTFVGSPKDDYLRARPQSLRIVIQFYSVSQPPWQPEGDSRLVSATYTIPDIDQTKIDWNNLKLACGGANGYLWGRYRATIILDNGRQIQAWGATKEEAEDRAKAFLPFTKGNPVKPKPTITEDQTEDNGGSFIKQPTRIYPAYFTIMNQYQIPGGQGSGIPIQGKRYIRKKDRIDLWVTQKPDDFDQIILDMLAKPGTEQEN